MIPTAEMQLRVMDLIHRFWARIDEDLDVSGPGLFTPGGELVIETFRAVGHDELARYFAGRHRIVDERQRSTRHVVSNARVLTATGGETGQARLRVQATVTVFSGYGARPAPLTAPSTLCDFWFDCLCDGEDNWLLERVEGLRIFAGEDTPDLSKSAASVAVTAAAGAGA